MGGSLRVTSQSPNIFFFLFRLSPLSDFDRPEGVSIISQERKAQIKKSHENQHDLQIFLIPSPLKFLLGHYGGSRHLGLETLLYGLKNFLKIKPQQILHLYSTLIFIITT